MVKRRGKKKKLNQRRFWNFKYLFLKKKIIIIINYIIFLTVLAADKYKHFKEPDGDETYLYLNTEF